MRTSTLVARILCSLFIFISVSAAWPWPPYSGSEGHGMLVKRQDKEDEKTTETEEAKPTATAETASATETEKKEEETATGTKTSDSEETGSKTGTKTEEATSTITDIDPRLPAGGIKMIEPPAALAQETYYKIGDDVTFKWNYTSLSVTPTGINVVASCSANSHAYTITANETVAETGAVTWDTGAYQADATVPLLTETYTLLVYDVDREPGDVAPAGHLGSSINFMFGMYLPKDPTPLSEWQCATCNAALSTMEGQALSFVFTMFTITVLSFAWFANGFGIFS